MKNKNFKTPILFLVFNRLDTTKRVFEKIRGAKPEELFIAADGPRDKKEKEKTDNVRSYIKNNIDWKCKVKTLYREKNLGCKKAVSEGISWFFDNVKRGIILEDDCLPSHSFFKFAEEMLERYDEDTRIMQVCGTNVEGVSKIEDIYFFAQSYNIWGWATWKRAWNKYDIDMKLWPKFKKENYFSYFTLSWIDKKLNTNSMDSFYKKPYDTWDYQWAFTCMVNNGLSIIPKKNLVQNIGFGDSGTHTINNQSDKILKTYELRSPYPNNKIILPRPGYLRSVYKFFTKGRIKRKLLKLFG